MYRYDVKIHSHAMGENQTNPCLDVAAHVRQVFQRPRTLGGDVQTPDHHRLSRDGVLGDELLHREIVRVHQRVGAFVGVCVRARV